MRELAFAVPVLAIASLVAGCTSPQNVFRERGYVHIAYLLSPGNEALQVAVWNELSGAGIHVSIVNGSIVDAVGVNKKDSKKGRQVLQRAASEKALRIQIVD